MKHLTDEQLSALLDDALPASERAECDAHLATCEACRARVAEYSALDESLGKALEHDPGEAYFADFADRVAARIEAAGAGPSAPEPAAARQRARSPWGWLMTPRGLTLAGSTAALLAVAGVAWMRFGHRDVTVAMRDEARSPVGATLRDQAVPPPATAPSGEANDAMVPRPVADGVPAEPAPSAITPPPVAPRAGAAPPAAAMRARQVRENASGNEVQVQSPQAGATSEGSGSRLDEREAKSAPAAPSPVAQIKRRAVVPAAEGAKKSAEQKPRAEAPALSKFSETLSRVEPSTSAKSLAADAAAERAKVDSQRTPTRREPDAASGGRATPAPVTSLSRPFSAVAPLEAKLELDSPCGTVHDTRGQPVASAQVIARGPSTHITRSGPDGRFCLPSLRVGDTLSVLRVGYEPVSVVVGTATSLALRLEPVGTLDPDAGRKLLAREQGSLLKDQRPDDRKRAFAGSTPSTSPSPDLYATQSAAVQQALHVAREASETARRVRTAAAYEKAFEHWDNLAGRITGPASYDARFQAMSALRMANKLEPTLYRASVLRSRLIAFLALVPDSLPEYGAAQRWKTEMGSAPRSTYR